MTNFLPVPRGEAYKDSNHKRDLETRNGYIQAAFVVFSAQNWNAESRLTPDLLCELQRLAVNQIYRCAGCLRDGPVGIANVEHRPPEHTRVPGLVEEMCEYLHNHWDLNAVHLASYLMWRINWIHPFLGGNGRTSRAASYLILCARFGFVLPGTVTLPEIIDSDSRKPAYYAALRKADEAYKDGRIDVSEMEALIDSVAAEQLVLAHAELTGKLAPLGPD